MISNAIVGMIEGVKGAMFRPINKAASAILGLFSILWGFWVANPWWEVFDSAQVYHVLNWLAPEWLWGTVPLVLGFLMLIGMKKGKFKFLTRGVLFGFYFWLFTASCLFIGDWQNTAGVAYSMIALYCGYVALNLSINRDYYLEK